MAVLTTSFDVAGVQLHCCHNELKPDRKTLLFIHGLGESGLCFMEALIHPMLRDYNILVPDLIGFGRSAAARTDDYSFDSQINRLVALLDATDTKQAHLVGHSMGGDLGTLFCRKYPKRVTSFVNIEGNLTLDDCFITKKAIDAHREERFERWLREDFTGGTVVGWAAEWPSCVRYIASLQLCSPPAFLASAQQMWGFNVPVPGSDSGIIGLEYKRPGGVAKVFCSSSKLSGASQEFLKRNKLLHQTFPTTCHWVMLDVPQLFYGFLAGFVAREARDASCREH